MESKNFQSRETEKIGYTKRRQQIRKNGEKEKDRDTEKNLLYLYTFLYIYILYIVNIYFK